MGICVCCPRWSHECTFFLKSGFLYSGLHCTQTNQLCRAYRLAKTYQKKERKEKKSTHTTPPFPHFSLHYPPMESTELHNHRDPAGHSGLDSLGGGLISHCGRSGREEVIAWGMLGLTEAVINYGLSPLVMHEKPTESTKRSLNKGAYFKGNLATFYWQDVVSVGGLMMKTVCSSCCMTQEAEFYQALFCCFFYQWHSCWPST